MPATSGSHPRVAIVGASSLLGKELKQVLEDRNFPVSEIVLLDESVVAGTDELVWPANLTELLGLADRVDEWPLALPDVEESSVPVTRP